MQSLGKLETQFFAWQQLSDTNRVETGDVCAALNISEKQERELLSRLKRKGFIVRLRKGMYLSPQKIPPGGVWQPSELILLESLMGDYGASYQISGPFAFQYYGLTEQVPNELFVYNDQISERRLIGTALFMFAKVDSSRLGSSTTVGDSSASIGTLPRVLLDAVYDWKRFNSLPIAYSWIAERIEDKKFIRELISCALEYGNVGTLRRLGYLLEVASGSNQIARRLKTEIEETTAFIAFDPTRPKRGSVSRKWGVTLNNSEYA